MLFAPVANTGKRLGQMNRCVGVVGDAKQPDQTSKMRELSE